jgi:uncharacterized protein (DUF302 family)
MPTDATGIASVESPHSIEATVSKLKAAIAGKGMTLFADIDHAAGARQVGLQMQEARVLIFGHPKGGTPLMVATPLLALDLPLKALVWEDADKKVRVSFTTTEFLAQRYGLSLDALKNIAGLPVLVKAALA